VAAKPPAPQTRERREHGTVEARVPLFGAGWRGPARGDPDFAALYLLSIALSRGESSRLQRALIGETPLCLSLQGDLDARKDASLFYVVAALTPGADTSKVESEVVDQVARLASTPLNEDELERAKRQAEAGLVMGWQTSRGRAMALGSGVMLSGDPRDAQNVLSRIRTLGAADLQKAAEKHLTAAHRSVVWLMPGAGPGTAPTGMEGKP
jgi:zinc protease